MHDATETETETETDAGAAAKTEAACVVDETTRKRARQSSGAGPSSAVPPSPPPPPSPSSPLAEDRDHDAVPAGLVGLVGLVGPERISPRVSIADGTPVVIANKVVGWRCTDRDKREYFAKNRSPGAMELEHMRTLQAHPGVLRCRGQSTRGLGRSPRGPGAGVILYEFLRGRELFDEVMRGRLRNPVNVMRWLADTLAFVHDAGFAHRDVKLENVMVQRCGSVVLVDWDEAVHVRSRYCFSRGHRSDVCVGTRTYTAPELMSDDYVRTSVETVACRIGARPRERVVMTTRCNSPALDVWAFACAVYVVHFRAFLFPVDPEKHRRAMDAVRAAGRVGDNVVPPDSSAHTPAQAAALDLVRTALVVDPERRPSMRELQRHFYFSQSS